jgi:hypothetical protein
MAVVICWDHFKPVKPVLIQYLPLQAKLKFTVQCLIRAFHSSQQLSSTSSSQAKVGNSQGGLLASEGVRGPAAQKRKGKRRGGSGRNEPSVLPSDADSTVKDSRPSDAPAAGADGDGQVAEEGHGEAEQAAQPRKAGSGRRPTVSRSGARRERSRGGAKDESAGAGSQPEAVDLEAAGLARTSAGPEPAAAETPAA